MKSLSNKWNTNELANAMEHAINSHADSRFLRKDGNKLKFNGFWRDGDKQNVCMWLDSATWHDAKTGEGGGCKEFARVAFDIDLKEFIDRFGHQTLDLSFSKKITKPKAIEQSNSIDKIWKKLVQRDSYRKDLAESWLSKVRGFLNPRSSIGSGFANLYEEDLELFKRTHYPFLKHRFSLGPQLIAPLRGFFKEEVQNLFFRSMSNTSKDEKTRLLPNSGGFGGENDNLLAFGFPHLIKDFPTLILCEGMADYFAVECLLGQSSHYLPLGIPGASALPKWANFLLQIKYQGQVIFLYQLDRDLNGNISANAIGQRKATEALGILINQKIPACLFDWPSFLREVNPKQLPKDIAETFTNIEHSSLLSTAFLNTLNRVNTYEYR